MCDKSSDYEEIMLQIGNALVSLDFAEKFFCCDISSCLGQCCIDGDAGAPITDDERRKIEEVLPVIWDDMLPAGRRAVDERGVAYIDEEGDLVTQLVDGGTNCAFTCYGEGGVCLCAFEKAWREGRIDFQKPVSCFLYPARLTEYPEFVAVNYHRWKICKCAEVLGRAKGIRLYQFLEQPLRRRFGDEWYDELALACRTYLADMENGCR